MKLWLLRHARVLAAPGVCYGISEVPADPEATQAAAAAFARRPGTGCPVWTSPAQRARQLALALLARRADLRGPDIDDCLREMDFGCWEMRAWNDIPRAALDAWTADFSSHRFGGKESAQQVIHRVSQALERARDLDVPEMVWVTHAGVIRAVQFLCAATNRTRIETAGEWPASTPRMGAWIRIEI